MHRCAAEEEGCAGECAIELGIHRSVRKRLRHLQACDFGDRLDDEQAGIEVLLYRQGNQLDLMVRDGQHNALDVTLMLIPGACCPPRLLG
jgi:hypothetical protein